MIKKLNATLIIYLLLGLMVVAYLFCFTVNQVDRALILRLGKLDRTGDGKIKVFEPGLHFKWPIITNVKYFDSRIQTTDLTDDRIVTKEKKDVIVSSYIKWRIKDFGVFYKATSASYNPYDRAGELLSQKASDALRAVFGQRKIIDVVSGSRSQNMDLIKQKIADKSKDELGLDVVDFRIMRIDLPAEVSESVYERMRAERQQAAAEYRANGVKQAEIIKANADKEVAITLAKATKDSNVIKAQGNAKAASIYANTYNKNPEFYSFFQSLNTYDQAFHNKSDILVMSPKNKFFQYFYQSGKKSG